MLIRITAPLAALLYPVLVWSGPALWAPLLVLALAPTLIAGWASTRVTGRARAVALVAVGAPALYSWLGGLLDWQHAIPLTSVRVWIPLWLGLAAIALPDRPLRELPWPRRVAIAHGIAAVVIALFALAHVANHLCGIAGGDVHTRVLHALRVVYRPLEPLLLGCIGVQVVTGAMLIRHRLARALSGFELLQTAAGAYLALFFLSHVTAVFRARARGIETDWRWISGDLVHDPWSARLVPYYALAVIALAVHLACAVRARAVRRGSRADGIAVAIVALSVAAAATIVTALLRG